MVREETEEDFQRIFDVNLAAFGHPDEGHLVDRLRSDGDALLSLVAEMDGEVVGHILFSRMFIDRGPAVALAPMAVIPKYQGRGIGSALIRRGLEILSERGERIVLVLGHIDFYPRFGFSAERTVGLRHPFPREAYMGKELVEDALCGVTGWVKYPPAFGIAEQPE